jgi:quercetin dioxygenase-like cupin family protein
VFTSLPDAPNQVPFKPGEVNLRKVMEVDGARVVMVAISAGAGMPTHRTPHPLLLQTLSGHVQLTVDDVTHDLRPGDLFHLTGGVMHAVHADVDSQLCLVLLLGTHG